MKYELRYMLPGKQVMLSEKSVFFCVLLVLLTSWSFDEVTATSGQFSEESLPRRRKITRKLCQTHSCIHTASEVLKNMDPCVNPCDNFYRFACGGYLKSAIIPDGFLRTSTSERINADIIEQLKTSLMQVSPPDEPRPLKLTKNFFKSCMNKVAIEKHGVDSLLKILNKVGGWPVMKNENWNADDFNWRDSIYTLNKMGYHINNMPRIFVAEDFKNSTRRIVHLTLEPSLDEFAPEGKYHIKNTVFNDMVNISVELGANRHFAEKEFENVFDFIKKLHLLNWRFAGSTYPSRMNLSTLGENLSTNLWKRYIKDLITPFSQVNDDEEVIVKSQEFILELEKLMNETPKNVQANFIIWSAMSQSMVYLSDGIREKYEKLQKDAGVTGPEKQHFRIKECFDIVSKFMPVGLSALHIRNHFNKKVKQSAIEMSKYIQSRINETLRQTKSLESLIKHRFLNKLGKMSFSTAYPNEFLDDLEFEKLYRNLNISSDNFLQNVLNLASFKAETEFAKLREPINELDWQSNSDFHTLEQNAFYDSLKNTVEIPASSLQGVLNKIGNPKYMIYGAAGSTIGHEIFHAFDSNNRNLDENGNIIEWDEVSEKVFQRSDQCLIDKYGNFFLPNTGLNGIKYLDENIADNGGVKMAYLAYLDWSSRNEKPEPQLPGLAYNPRQMFWISFTNDWCEKWIKPNFYDAADIHAPSEFRIIGILSNIPEFAHDFNCSINSTMNPSNRCSIW